MSKRYLLSLIFLMGIYACSPSPSTLPVADDQTFTFDSVTYNNGGKPTTQKFENGLAVVFADSVKNDITIEGSYGPGKPVVTAIKVGISKDRVLNLTPQFNDGKWSATIQANQLTNNAVYSIEPDVKGKNITASARLGIGIK